MGDNSTSLCVNKVIFMKLHKKTNVVLSVYLYFILRMEDLKSRLKDGLIRLKEYFENEKDETREMIDIYRRFNRGEATVKELKKANHQFRDILKSIGLGFLIVMPFSPVTLPIILKLGDKLGIQVLPDFFEDSRG